MHRLQSLIILVERIKERTKKCPLILNIGAAGYQGPVRLELRSGVGLVLWRAL